ncbi:MAG: M23 family metallopeptidase [Kiloniellales bacterium]
MPLHHRGGIGFLVLAALMVLPADVAGAAERLRLDGPLMQGGLVRATAAPGASVRLDGRPVRVSPEGLFLLGFGRDASGEARLEVTWPDGRREVRVLEVASRRYEVQRIDGLPPELVTPGPEDLARAKREAAMVRRARWRDDPRTDFLDPFIWPVTGRITGVYGSRRVLNGNPRRPHYGIDIVAPPGTPVMAPAAGVVTFVHPDMFFSGATLILDHGHGLSSGFLHLQDILVVEGERVARGQPIATVGASGRVTGPHLDWRLNWFQTRLDPALVVGPMPAGR